MIYSTIYLSPIGKLLLASDGESIIGLWVKGQKYFADNVEDLLENDELQVFAVAKKWLDRYFAGKKPAITELPLKPKGGQFRQDVWKILCDISYGNVVTYGFIAKELAKKAGKERMSAQAVGGAVGHNPISIIIPCHRVVGVNGSLTGYAGGIVNKIQLLKHEGVDMSKLFVPKNGTAL